MGRREITKGRGYGNRTQRLRKTEKGKRESKPERAEREGLTELSKETRER